MLSCLMTNTPSLSMMVSPDLPVAQIEVQGTTAAASLSSMAFWLRSPALSFPSPPLFSADSPLSFSLRS